MGDPILKSNMTRCVDFALFMVKALENDQLLHEAPAIVGCRTSAALAHAAATGSVPDRYAALLQYPELSKVVPGSDGEQKIRWASTSTVEK